MILGLGAYLVIERGDGGCDVCCPILLDALQPVDKSWIVAEPHIGARRLRPGQNLLVANPPRDPALTLPGRRSAVGGGLGYVIPGTNRAILRNVSVRIEPAEVLGIIGPSGKPENPHWRAIVGILRLLQERFVWMAPTFRHGRGILGHAQLLATGH